MKKLFLMFMTVIFGLSLAACYDDEETTPVELTDLETAFTAFYDDYSTYVETTIDEGFSYVVKDAEGNELGNAYQLTGTNRRGDIVAVVGFDTDSKVVGVEVLSTTQTESYMDAITETYYDSFVDTETSDDLNKLDIVSGSTQSSYSIQYIVSLAMDLENNTSSVYTQLLEVYADDFGGYKKVDVKDESDNVLYSYYNVLNRRNATVYARVYEITEENQYGNTSDTLKDGSITALVFFDNSSEVLDVRISNWGNTETWEPKVDSFLDEFDGTSVVSDLDSIDTVSNATQSSTTIKSIVSDAIAYEVAANEAYETSIVSALAAAYTNYSSYTVSGSTYTILDSNDDVLGYAYESVGTHDSRGAIVGLVSFDTESSIIAIDILYWGHSSSYETKIVDDLTFFNNIMSSTEADLSDVDVVTGATHSSDTVIELVVDAIQEETDRVADALAKVATIEAAFAAEYSTYDDYTISAEDGYTLYTIVDTNDVILGYMYLVVGDYSSEILDSENNPLSSRGTLEVAVFFNLNSEVLEVITTEWNQSGSHESNLDDTFYGSFDGLTTEAQVDTAMDGVTGSTQSKHTVAELVKDAIELEAARVA